MKKFFLFLLALLTMSSYTVSYAAMNVGAAGTTQVSENPTAPSKKEMKKEVKEKLKQAKKSADDNKILAVILAILIPFVGVAVYESGITKHFWIDLLLTLLFYLPGLIYALYIILS